MLRMPTPDQQFDLRPLEVEALRVSAEEIRLRLMVAERDARIVELENRLALFDPVTAMRLDARGR